MCWESIKPSEVPEDGGESWILQMKDNRPQLWRWISTTSGVDCFRFNHFQLNPNCRSLIWSGYQYEMGALTVGHVDLPPPHCDKQAARWRRSHRNTAVLTDGDRDDWQQSRLGCRLTEQTGRRGAHRDEALAQDSPFSDEAQSLM